MIFSTIAILISSFTQADSREKPSAINIPFDSIKGTWAYVGKYGASDVSWAPLPNRWQFDTFEIKKPKTKKFPKKFNNKYVTDMARHGYFANTLIIPFDGGKPVDSLIFYHDNTNSCGEHSIQYYGTRRKGEMVLRRVVADTMYFAFRSSLCKSTSPSIDSSCYVFVKQKCRRSK